MKPEASSQKLKVEPEQSGAREGEAEQSQKSEYLELGVPEEWVEPLKALGYTTIEKLKEVGKPGKLHQEMMGYRKKNKLEIGTVTMEQVSSWVVNE